MNLQDQNRALVLDIYRKFELGDRAACRAAVSPDCRCHVSGNALDADSWLAFGTMFMNAFPDGRHVWEVAEAAGDYVLLNGYFTGTHRGPFQGLAPTGKVVKFSATIVEKVIGGRLVEHRGDFDTAGLMQQLGGPEAHNRALVEKMLAAVDAQDWPATLELVAPECTVQIGSFRADREGWMAMGKGFYEGFPDGRHQTEDWVVSSDRVVAFGTWTGTHRGPFQGVPATGKRVSFSFVQSYRLRGEKIVEHRGEFDAAGLMQQLSG